MKTILILALCMFALVGCGDGNSSSRYTCVAGNYGSETQTQLKLIETGTLNKVTYMIFRNIETDRKYIRFYNSPCVELLPKESK